MSDIEALDYSLPLSDLLREGTKVAHTSLETSAGAGHLLRGELDRENYARYLMMLWHIYLAFEEALETHSSHPTLSPTYNPTLLARAPALSTDIAVLLDTAAWQSSPLHTELLASPPAGLTNYVNRIKELTKEDDPSALLAHSYVRYLGDLSGGQQIRRIIAKAYQLDEAPGSGGLQFYDFKELGGSGKNATLGDMKKIKEWFRAGMNAGAGDDPSVKASVLEEANTAFILNAGIFESLEALKAEEISSPQVKESIEIPIIIERGPAPETAYPLATVLAVVGAVCLAHGLLVVSGFTGEKGYNKLIQAEEWVASLLK